MYAEVVVNTPVKKRFSYSIPDGIEASVGMRALVPFGKVQKTGYIVSLSEHVDDDGFVVKPIKRIIDKEPLFGEAEVELAHWMSRFYLCSEGQAISAMIPAGHREIEPPIADIDEGVAAVPSESLTMQQQQAIEMILGADQPMHYLYGVTGSGKSEVFLRIAEAVIAQGRQVIYLVPEITLTHQLANQVMKRFAGNVAVLHSGLSPSQRLREWKRIKKGKVSLVIGARSAVFAPFSHLGLIIMDEEHENSYKSSNTPRYHARQIAQRRIAESGALFVMGSATPSLEAWMMMEEGKVRRHVLSERVAGGKSPEITVVNMLSEQHILSRRLVKAMQEVLSRNRQIILFLNRRGFSHFFHCRSCGYEMLCPHCSVSLTYHKESNMMICHYCGYRRRPITVCPTCSSVDVGYSGFGTEMVEQEVMQFFPDAKITRIDTDSAKEKGLVARVLQDFRNGFIDILLGTQMVAKGLNFPLVDLVGIVLADSALNIPDFRAQERTFSLIVQVSGRAGRFNEEGKVIVQTFHPENAAIQLAVSGEYERFYQEELALRRLSAFPPAMRLVNIVIRGRNKEKTEHEIERLYRIAVELLDQMRSSRPEATDLPEILGVAQCPIEKIAENWRYHLVLRGSNFGRVLQVATVLQKRYKAPSGIHVEIDIDPLQLL